MRCWQCPHNNNNDNENRRRHRAREGGDVGEAQASVVLPTGLSDRSDRALKKQSPTWHTAADKAPSPNASSSPLLSSLSPVKLHDFTHTHITHSRTCDDEGKKKGGGKKTSQRQRGSAGGGSGSSATRRCFLHSTAAPPKLLKHSSVRTGVRQSPQAREGGRGEELIAWPCGALPSGASSSSSSGGKRWPCVSPAASPSDSAQCRPESPSC